MRRLLVIALLAFGSGAVAAHAATAPIVPRSAQAKIAAKAPALAYAPTRIAIGFRYYSWEHRPGVLRIRFRNKAGWEITFVAQPFQGSCRDGMTKSFQLAGNKVYWAQGATEQQAWRCVVGRNGRPVRLVAASTQPPTRFADVGLGTVVASGKRIS
jgi:hypothetical protein